ncbi:MAG: hypothetical protein HYR84_14855 [Planctomycetes bacterium]|nr:hypothetical protein [Planctomycetota bacterium]
MASMRWFVLVIVSFATAAGADACTGLLRRLFGPPPRAMCQPAPMPMPPAAKTEVKPAPIVSTLEGRITFPNAPRPKFHSPLQLARKDRLLGDLLIDAKEKGILDQGAIVIPKNAGIANVVVFLRRPQGKAWPIADIDKVREHPLVIDAPLAVFEPHVSALYPEWNDGKNRGKTGQQAIIRNTSPLAQNYRGFGNPKFNDGFNVSLRPQTQAEVSLRVQPLPIVIHDDLHNWKSAFVFVFDHPYFASTDRDGAFIIPRVPVGMDVQVMAWHETQGWLLGSDGETMTLKKGKNALDFEMSAK